MVQVYRLSHLSKIVFKMSVLTEAIKSISQSIKLSNIYLPAVIQGQNNFNLDKENKTNCSYKVLPNTRISRSQSLSNQY